MLPGDYACHWEYPSCDMQLHTEVEAENTYVSLSNSRMFELSPTYCSDIVVDGFDASEYKIVPLQVNDATYKFKLSTNGNDDTGKIAVLIGLDPTATSNLTVTQTLSDFKAYKLRRTNDESLEFEVVQTYTDSFSC